MFIISQLFCLIHVIIDKFTTGFLQSRSLGVGMDHTCLEIFNPLLKGRDSHFVELVHANKEILRKDLGRQFTDDGVLLFGAHLQKVARVDRPCGHPRKSSDRGKGNQYHDRYQSRGY